MLMTNCKLGFTTLNSLFAMPLMEYIEDCQLIGKTQGKRFSGRFNLRISPALHRQAVTQAEKEGISLNTLVERALQTVL